MKKDNTKPRKGFTLIETLVAIAILLIAVVGPMSVIGGSLSQTSTIRDQSIAINLAQEGVEVVRQKRDSNMINAWGGGGATWSDGIIAGYNTVNSVSGGILFSCSGTCTINQQLVYQDAAGWYSQGSGGIPTKFNRVVRISDISSMEKGILSEVTWSIGGTLKSVKVEESIFGINS